MGQTLSHGVYLPNEGERNCYAGLASNWQILNTAVGAIAEKAPLVHTHTVSQITDFPAYGTTAGTICEGNDSRLSDARTPVAHTHGKADVTDLLNSNFIPSANNSYDLGSSSYQWNNLYAKKTYTDTVKAGTGDLTLQSKGTNKNIAIYNGSSSGDGAGLFLYGKDHSNGSLCRFQIYNTNVPRYEAIDFANSTFYSYVDKQINLGDSTHKWKTLNGINPGALSLPNINYTEGSPDVYNVGTDINNLTKNTADPLHFAWTSPFDGWLSITWFLRDLTPPFNVLVTSDAAILSKFSQTWSASSTRWFFATTFPVVKNVTYYFDVDFQNTTIGVVHHAYLLPCLGNV